jgi:futalosine hydrolase
MEGAASALVAVRFDIPFLELRGISNRAGNRNRQEWDLAGACRIAELALLALLPDWPGGGS